MKRFNTVQGILEATGVTLPNMSNLLGVAKLRYMQSVCEPMEKRNPDYLVRDVLPPLLRLHLYLKGKLQRSQMRKIPFYPYLLARTKHYDQVVLDAIGSGAKFVVGIGVGSDTRPYRFADQMIKANVSVLECDQPSVIALKEKLAKRNWQTEHVSYLSVDLNSGDWSELERWLRRLPSPVLILMEAVSPYIDASLFEEFLRLIAANACAGSRLAYDYKILGVDDNFGLIDGCRKSFRLSVALNDVEIYHQSLGYELKKIELDWELTLRLSSGMPGSLPREDCLLILTVASK